MQKALLKGGEKMESQRQTKSRERNERIPEKTIQKELTDSGSNRTLLQSDQMSIWLQKGPVQRIRKESGTSIHFIGISQSVHAQRKIIEITPSLSRKKNEMRTGKYEKSQKKPVKNDTYG